MSATSLVTCLMPWPTAPAWDSPQKTEIMTTIDTPTALAVTQVAGGSKLAERPTLMEGIRGWGQKDALWEGRAFTGSLAQGPHIPSRRPRSPYDRPLLLKASTEPHKSYLFLQHYWHFSQTFIISNAQMKISIEVESEVTDKFLVYQQHWADCFPTAFCQRLVLTIRQQVKMSRVRNELNWPRRSVELSLRNICNHLQNGNIDPHPGCKMPQYSSRKENDQERLRNNFKNWDCLAIFSDVFDSFYVDKAI